MKNKKWLYFYLKYQTSSLQADLIYYLPPSSVREMSLLFLWLFAVCLLCFVFAVLGFKPRAYANALPLSDISQDTCMRFLERHVAKIPARVTVLLFPKGVSNYL
jgi:hypothetical protein